MSLIVARPEVVRFAAAMERKLEANDHKRGWKHCETLYLMRRLRNEVGELAVLVNAARRGEAHVDRDAILSEAADVANFAMMVADVLGALKE